MHKDAGPAGWWLVPVQNRGRRWAEAVFARTKGLTPWPPFGGAMIRQAMHAILDMVPTTDLGHEMMRTAYDAAKERYQELCAGVATR